VSGDGTSPGPGGAPPEGAAASRGPGGAPPEGAAASRGPGGAPDEGAARGRGRAGARGRARARGESGDLRAVETTVLLLVALLLAIATVNDVVRQTHVNQRLIADLSTWRQYTGLRYHNLAVAQDYTKNFTREVVCGNTSPGEPKQRIQLCLVITGRVRAGRRHVTGGWYLPARAEDEPSFRYGCFGSAGSEFECTR
jgi:hypothetical protein